eukprot:2328042-Amphidinium_carterae.1
MPSSDFVRCFPLWLKPLHLSGGGRFPATCDEQRLRADMQSYEQLLSIFSLRLGTTYEGVDRARLCKRRDRLPAVDMVEL